MTRQCKDCGSCAACRFAFAKFWPLKSSNGAGCDFPFNPPPQYLATMREIQRRSATCAEVIQTATPNTKSAETRICVKYAVLHNGEEYRTLATSPADAINKVRFRIYGLRKEDTLPPFSALPTTASASQLDHKQLGVTARALRARFAARKKGN